MTMSPRQSDGQDEVPQNSSASSPALRARVIAQLAQYPSPTRTAVVRESAALTALSWVFSLGVFVYGGGPSLTGRPWGLMLGTVMGTGLASAVVVWVALVRGRSSLQRAWHVIVPTTVCAPLAILGWKVLWSSGYPGALDAWATRPGFRCLGLGVAIGVLPLMAFLLARRSSDPRRPALTGFAAGVAIGCIAALLTDLWCPVAYVPHLLLGHILPISILGGIGASLGRRFVALRGAR